MHVERYARGTGRLLHPVHFIVCNCAIGDNMGIWAVIKDYILDAKFSRDSVADYFYSVLKAIDENDDGYITMRELIKVFNIFRK